MQTKTWRPEQLMTLANGYWATFALHAAAQTGLTARLAAGPLCPEAAADELGLDARATGMLLTAMLALGLARKDGDTYEAAPGAAAMLDPESPTSLHNYIMHMADMAPDWARLAQSVRSGGPVAQKGGQGGAPDRSHFYRAMAELARARAPMVAEHLAPRDGQRLLDLGGGPGIYALTFAAACPGLKATVFDLPGAERHFQEQAARLGLEGRVSYIIGDYRHDDMGGPYDVVWLSHVLHGAPLDVCDELVAKAAAAMAPGGVLWVQEFVLDRDDPTPPFAALFALNMLVNTGGGATYTAAEICGMMERAGLSACRDDGALPPGSPVGLVRGEKP